MLWEWLSLHWSNVLGDIGIVAGLFFSGFGFWRDIRIRRAETLLEITKQHRDIWQEFHSRRELSRIFVEERDMAVSPLTDHESTFLNLLILHIRAAYFAGKARIYVQPEHLPLDLASLLSYPAFRAAWRNLKRFHEAEFVLFVESCRGE